MDTLRKRGEQPQEENTMNLSHLHHKRGRHSTKSHGHLYHMVDAAFRVFWDRRKVKRPRVESYLDMNAVNYANKIG